MGTPTSPDPLTTVLKEVREGKTLRDACAAAGTDIGALLDRAERCPTVRRRLDRIQRLALAMVQDALYENAVHKLNVTAQQFLLCNRAPERWRPASSARTADDLPAPERVTPAELLARYSGEDESAKFKVA